jgi:hypothetical protein
MPCPHGNVTGQCQQCHDKIMRSATPKWWTPFEVAWAIVFVMLVFNLLFD